MTAAPSIKSQLRSAISDVQSKAAQVESGTYSQDVAADRAAQAHNVTRVKENLVAARERDLDNVLQQLAPPPTKEVSAGGKNGGTKTIVDKEEVARLQKEKTSIMAQLENAKQDVSEARTEAAAATTQALTAAGVTQEAQNDMAALMSRIDSINDSLSQGQHVSDDEMSDVIKDFKQLSDSFDKEDNVSGAISKAFYNPMKAAMERMLGHLNSPKSPRNTNPNTNSAPGTINADLAAVGITGQKQDDVVSFIQRVDNINQGIQAGQTFTQDQMQSLYDDKVTLVSSLTDAQRASKPIQDLKKSVEDVVKASGHGDAVLPVSAGAGAG